VSIRVSPVVAREQLEIITGSLNCESCDNTWPIVRGVPRFAAINEVERDKATTAEKFGWQWQHFNQFESGYENQFLAWIAPVTREFFKDKVVLEGGCGKGRHTQLAAQFGARDVIGVDLSDAVETAFAASRCPACCSSPSSLYGYGGQQGRITARMP